MKKILKILLILIIFSINSCSKNKEQVSQIIETDLELQMIDAYREGVKSLELGDVTFAAKKFKEAELLYPQSEWAAKSSLMAAYSYYSQDYFYEAISLLNRFLETYPKYENISYAHFLLGMCHYESIVDEKKDLEPLLKAQEKFNFIIKNYPETDFALDAKFKIGLIKDILASKEMYIARHYIKKEKWVGAINRLKIIISEYDTTVFTEEALHRLVEIHYRIGLENEAKKYAAVLGYNYQSSEWYQQSYKVINKDYIIARKQEIKKKKYKGNFLHRKFLSIFQSK